MITVGNKRRHGQEISAVKTPGTRGVRGLSDRPPLACGAGNCGGRADALCAHHAAIAGSVGTLFAEQVGKWLRFADEISGRADRNTVVDRGATQESVRARPEVPAAGSPRPEACCFPVGEPV